MKPALAALLFAAACPGLPAEPGGQTIQTALLDAARPYFIPTHPRVTTTVRFPGPIGAPDGAVTIFTEDVARQPAEYLVSWQTGEPYFTLTPLRDAPMANLNVPYQGQTYVIYFYSVADPLQAVALVNLQASTARGASPTAAEDPKRAGTVSRRATPPPEPYVVATPARLVGFLDRLKLIHATPPGAGLASLTQAMNVEVALSREEQGDRHLAAADGGSGEAIPGLNDAGLYQLILLRAVRDRRLNCLGFICLLRNSSNQELVFDVNSFAARCGAEYLGQRISDAPATLKPGDQSAAYFIVQPPAGRPLKATNTWRLSAELVSPRLNPGAALARGFARPKP